MIDVSDIKWCSFCPYCWKLFWNDCISRKVNNHIEDVHIELERF